MKCFITKFPFSTGNTKLPYANGLRINIPKQTKPKFINRGFTINTKNSSSPITVEVNNGNFVDQKNFTDNIGSKDTFTGQKSFVISNDDAWIDIYPKENMIYFQDYFGANDNGSVMSFNLADLQVSTLNNFNWANSGVFGDIGNLKYATNIFNLNLSGTQVSGDISGISTLVKLTGLNLINTQVSGDISGISTLVNLTGLSLINTQVSGDISGIIENCTKLKSLAIPKSVTITEAQKNTLVDRGCTVKII